ncbi:hypothetical protein [Beijerinckia sp. L45]|uniref:hypothetical protein n=1 Tax=Beijerinckia sp. L45 TaxID=1641855 RepID=UPI00131CA99F|nr:hypothetical protein [Beijerinckia sp. L45]
MIGAAMTAPTAVSKSEFAKICGVSPGRVTQWIDEGKLNGAALVGEGRSARINVEIGQRQVNLRRDVGQALGNGLATKLEAPARRVHEDREEDLGDGATDDVDRKLKLAKLEASERANRMAAIEEAAAQGLYTDTASSRSEMGKIAGQMVRIFEGALPEIATALAAEFKLETRDVTHHLNEQFRKFREKAALIAEAAAGAIPETLPDAA